MSSVRFKNFQERYEKINAEPNKTTEHKKLEEFLFSKIDSTLKGKAEAFNFYFDSERQKLIFRIIGGMCNGDASDIIHYFRNYDEKAIWGFDSTPKTIRLFELDLEKAGEKLLNDLEFYLNNPKENHVSSSKEIVKEYIPPTQLSETKTKSNSNWSNAKTVGTIVGVFAFGAAAVLTRKLLQHSEEINNNIMKL